MIDYNLNTLHIAGEKLLTNFTNMAYDIIRFYKSGRSPKLIKCNCTKKQKDEWCSSSKTSKYQKWFDGFTNSETYSFACQKKRQPMYPANYSVNEL